MQIELKSGKGRCVHFTGNRENLQRACACADENARHIKEKEKNHPQIHIHTAAQFKTQSGHCCLGYLPFSASPAEDKNVTRVGEMVRQLRVMIALAEDHSVAPSSHVRQLTVTWNSSSRS